MNRLPAITRSQDDSGNVTYHFVADGSWDGFESLVAYFRKHWGATVTQSDDAIYARTWCLRVNEESVVLSHDGYGNDFKSALSPGSPSILEEVYADLLSRFEQERP